MWQLCLIVNRIYVTKDRSFRSIDMNKYVKLEDHVMCNTKDYWVECVTIPCYLRTLCQDVMSPTTPLEINPHMLIQFFASFLGPSCFLISLNLVNVTHNCRVRKIHDHLISMTLREIALILLLVFDELHHSPLDHLVTHSSHN